MRIAPLAALVLTASTLLLAGCAPTPQVPAGLTPEQTARIVEAADDVRWNSFAEHFPGVERPLVQMIEYINPDLWAYTYVRCMQKAGITDVSDEAGGIHYLNGSGDDEATNLAFYVCTVQYPYNPSDEGYLSPQQLVYMQDYFSNRLVPCLQLLGYHVVEPNLRQSDVNSDFPGVPWNPYDGLMPAGGDSGWADIDLRCPPLPPSFGELHP